MRKFLFLAALAGLATLPAGAAPIDAGGALREAVRAAAPGATPVFWHAGGTGAYGARPTYAYHGYGGVEHYGTYYRPPVPAPVPYYNPGGSFAAGAIVGGMAGAAVGAAAASASRPPPAATTVYNYGQPPTVVNNYYNN